MPVEKTTNILVTGAGGQLGRSLQKIAAAYPEYRLVFTRRAETDIADEQAVERALRESGARALINCAAYTAVDRAETEADQARRANALGPAVLAAAALRRDIPLVHISTDYVFSGRGNRPLTEDDAPDPESVYGRTKLEGEQAVRRCGCRAAVVRTGWLYSEFGRNFVKTMLQAARQGRELSVVDDQTGGPTYAEDLARAILELIKRGIGDFSLYHYADQGAVSWYDFARAIFDLSGVRPAALRPIRTEEYAAAAPRPRYSVLDKTKIKSLGIETPLWRDSLARCIETLKHTEL